MTTISKFKNFNCTNSKLDENVQSAKNLLLSIASDRKRAKLNIPQGEKVNFTPEEEKKILNDPRYINIRDYFLNTVKSPNLIYPFTYFSLVEGLPMNCGDPGNTECFSVVNLKKKWDLASPMMQTFPLPLENMDSYIKEKIKNNNDKPAYEQLWDDLTEVLSQKPVKEFIDAFPGAIRQEFTKSLKLKNTDPVRKNLIERIYNAVYDLKKIKPIYDDETGKEITATRSLIDYASKYKDTRTYPEFKDTYVAFKEFVRDCEDKVSGWGSGIGEFLIELESIAPSIKILYRNLDTGLVVTSARSAKGMRSVCKISNATYCIMNDETFWSQTSKCLQISFNLLKLPKTDDRYLTSFTINPKGEIIDSANRRNVSVNNRDENYIKFLKRYGLYEEGAVKELEKQFNSEFSIKKIVESIEKKALGSKDKLLASVGSLGIQKGMEENEYTKGEIDTFKNIIISIIKKDNNITYKDVIDFFAESENGGFFAKEDIELFEDITENNYNKEDVRKILEVTVSAISALIETKKIPGLNPNALKAIEFVIDEHPKIVEYVKSRML